MEQKLFTSKFSSILEAEILDDAQLEALEGGSGSCQQSCKKSCQPGNQNTNIGNGNTVETIEVSPDSGASSTDSSNGNASIL